MDTQSCHPCNNHSLQIWSLSGDDDDSDTEKRFKNLTRYQADRVYKELVLFMPFLLVKLQLQRELLAHMLQDFQEVE